MAFTHPHNKYSHILYPKSKIANYYLICLPNLGFSRS